MYVYLPRNGRELDPTQVREEPAEIAELMALPPAPCPAPASALVAAGILLPASGRPESGG